MGGFGGGVEAEAVNFIVDKINVIGFGISGPFIVYFISQSVFGILENSLQEVDNDFYQEYQLTNS